MYCKQDCMQRALSAEEDIGAHAISARSVGAGEIHTDITKQQKPPPKVAQWQK